MSAAFLGAIERIKSRATLSTLIRHIEAGNVQAALQSLNISPAVFSPVADIAAQSYTAAGHTTADALDGLRGPRGAEMVVHFNGTLPEASQQVMQLGTKITGELSAETLEAARIYLQAGIDGGINPRQTALNLIGRIGPSGRREGGIIGLTRLQERYVARARANLLSGDPVRMAEYLNLTRRDKRLDSAVKKAIAKGTKLPPAFVDKAIGRLSDSYLLLRGETIARTETLAAMNQGARQATEQMMTENGVPRETVVKVWRTSIDGRERESHRALNRVSVGIDALFPNGLLYPHDPNGPPAEVINCRCLVEYDVDYFAGLE